MDKDYYDILEIPKTASEQEIRKAYRQLVMKYHPDRNEGNASAEHQFRQVQEAYETLSNPGRRSSYNQQRCQSGSAQPHDITITSYHIFLKSKELTRYLATLGDQHVNRPALKNYIRQLLKESHINKLLLDDHSANVMIIEELIISMGYLSFNDSQQIAARLIKLADNDNKSLTKIDGHLKQRQLAYNWNKYLPLVVLMIAILLCLFIYIVSNA